MSCSMTFKAALLVMLAPATLLYRVDHSTTDPPCVCVGGGGGGGVRSLFCCAVLWVHILVSQSSRSCRERERERESWLLCICWLLDVKWLL